MQALFFNCPTLCPLRQSTSQRHSAGFTRASPGWLLPPYRYIGEGYSQAQEALEDRMREFYGQNRAAKAPPSLVTGLLAAVKTEEEEEFLRARVCEVMADKVKVRGCFLP